MQPSTFRPSIRRPWTRHRLSRHPATPRLSTSQPACPRLDFRSDTRTVPDARMRAAMARAEVGDDVYGDDPTVALLEQEAARLLGTEAALLTPTGTMANLLAPLAAFGPGSPPPRLIAGSGTHMTFLESAGLRRFGRIELTPVAQHFGGLPDLDALAALLSAPADRPTVVCVENTSMMHAGNALDAAATRAVAATAHRHGAHFHLDGARLANAAVALDVPPAQLAGPADSIAFSVSKGLGAPAGALLCGTSAYIAYARELRGWLGGSLHQAGVVAAPALIALRRLPDLAADHRRAAALADGLAALPGVTVMRPPQPTNMVMARLAGLSARECAARLAGHNVRVLPLPNHHVRFVTHRAHDMIGVREAVGAVAAVAATTGAGRRPTENSRTGSSP
ncbi:low specificity L-threonine aldolase [Streptomyces sp. NBC_00568]|uniref:threonine aldolase family protein n=1 Tax=Streptomyces sp. NBC_00568 TaxID=2975779 RepID=UPI00224FE180|nr:GntG family PLP-dependent aldolase [Streptomyces sp. NBC_00568]MCX4993215.1 beta-eliminating lyase-related protein [Streptomyces sp. NBC_00568]